MVSVISKDKKKPYLLFDKYIPVLLTAKYPEYYEQLIEKHLPEIVQETPWSNVFRFTTSKSDVYLKQPAPLLAHEAKVLQLLAHQFNASVPVVIAINDDLHCFLMKDSGPSLRKYIKSEFHPDLLCQSIKAFAAFQRSTENNIEPFLTLEVPDWRLNKLPQLYEQIINQADFLKADGMTEEEL